jgi:hypothetical protein
MNKTLLQAVVEEKLLMRYLTSIDSSEYTKAYAFLTDCIGYGVLTAILPFYETSQQHAVVEVFTHADKTTQQRWLAQQTTEVKLSIRETVERILLSLS